MMNELPIGTNDNTAGSLPKGKIGKIANYYGGLYAMMQDKYIKCDDQSPRCRIREGWKNYGRKGWLIGICEAKDSTQQWAIVHWDDQEDPDLFKASGLEIQTQKWVPLL